MKGSFRVSLYINTYGEVNFVRKSRRLSSYQSFVFGFLLVSNLNSNNGHPLFYLVIEGTRKRIASWLTELV